MTWIKIDNLLELKKGNRVRGINCTYSQKYLDIDGYEKYNETREGIIINSDFKDFFSIIIMDDEFNESPLVYDLGSSGYFWIEKWIK